MSELLEEKSVMAPQISPKDIPRGEENSDSEEGEPVAPVILENSSSDDEDNMEDGELDLNQGYVQLAQDDNEGQQTPDQWLSNTEEEGSEVESAAVIVTNDSESNSSSSEVRLSEPEMKQEQVDLIRQVMSGITLPMSAIPEWAKVVPEEKWKASLVSSITNRTQLPPDSETKK